MNPPDSNPHIHFDSDDSDSEERRLFWQQFRAQQLRHERLRRRRMAQLANRDVSSDSEVDEVSKGVKAGKMDVTPASSTPQELVKLDP